MLLFTHPAMLRHETPQGHPERIARLEAVLAALEGLELDRREAPEAGREALALVHEARYLDQLDARFPEEGASVALDPDTFLSGGSRAAALRAAGAVVAAVDAVLDGPDTAAFCAVRPPGHHAEPGHAMGFCLYNNVAIGALHALDVRGLKRAAILDFDVHHGNGSQTVAEREPRIFFASSHQYPFYPGTGAASEHGPTHNIVNAPLAAGQGGQAFRRAWEAEILPAMAVFDPEIILVSAGFDAHKRDPLAELGLDESDYAWIGSRLRHAAASCHGRIVASLEGGYDLQALAASAAAFVRSLAGD
jgi:acetoin utilization deacetylase AcuC-like enzyme